MCNKRSPKYMMQLSFSCYFLPQKNASPNLALRKSLRNLQWLADINKY